MADRQIKISVDIVQGSGGTTKVKATLNEVSNEVKRIHKETADSAKKTDAAINASQKAASNARIKENKAVANEFLRNLKAMETGAKQSANQVKSHFSDAFKGGFLGGLTGALSTQLAQLPRMFKTTLDEMVSIAAERQNAFKGLESIASFKGINRASAQEAVQSLRLVKAGVVDITEATTAMKNLLATGFTLPQATTLMERFSDSAAFGKQAALGFGEAIRSATEGLKNGNSILVDNAGVTKNLSNILEEHGKKKEDVSKITSDASVREAVYAGLIKETAGQVGDADKLVQGYTGSTAALATAQKNLYAVMGDIITRNPELLALIQTLTDEINGNTKALSANESQARSTFSSWVSFTAKAGIAVANFADEAQADITAVMNFFASLALATATGITQALSTLPQAFNKFVIEPANAVMAMAQSHPWLFPFAAGGLSPITPIATGEGTVNQLARATQLTWAGTSNSAAKQRSNTRWARFNENVDANRNAATPSRTGSFWGVSRPSRNIGTDPGTYAGGGASGGGGRRSGGVKADADEMRRYFEDQGFTVVRTTGRAINSGSLHPLGRAADISIRGKNVSQITELVAGAIEHGYRLFDERVKRPGVKQTGPHLHFEKNQGKASDFLNQSYYSAPIDYLRSLDQKRLTGKTAAGKDDVGKFLEQQSKEMTEADRNAHLDKMVHIYKMLGLVPTGEMLKELHEKMVKEAQAAGQSTYGMSAERTALGFGRGTVEMRDTPLQTTIDLPSEAAARELLAKTLAEMNEEQFNLNEHTAVEIEQRKILLGVYKDLNPEQRQIILNHAAETDAMKAKKKADEEATKAVEKYRDEQQRTFEDTQDFFANKLDSLIGGGFKGLWSSILDDMKHSFIDKASKLLAQMFTGAGATTSGQQQGGFGGIFNGIFGRGSGGSTGPLGGPDANDPYILHANGFNNLVSSNNPLDALLGPVLSNGRYGTLPGGSPGTTGAPGRNGGSGGGIWSQLTGAGGLFGPRKNLLTGKMSKLGGAMGGIGDIAAMVGGFIPGRTGKAIQYAGMGASLGSMFGPIGAGIGAGIGALVGIFGGKDNVLDKLKSAALSEFGISVKDKKVLESLKAVGEGMFGKGQVGQNATAVVRSEQGQNILLAYAENSGQSGKQIDRLNYGNAEWSGNQYRSQFGGFRANGGPVTAGYSYVVGERRAEMFTPTVNGMISPSVTTSDPRMMEMLDRIHSVLDNIETMPPHQVIAMGAKNASREIAGAVQYEYENDGRATQRTAQANGYVG